MDSGRAHMARLPQIIRSPLAAFGVTDRASFSLYLTADLKSGCERSCEKPVSL